MTNPLDNRMLPNNAEAKTFREYFRMLLLTLWTSGERFDPTAPFGNTEWDEDLLSSMVHGRLINGELDDKNRILVVDREAGHKLVTRMISFL